MMQRGDSEKQAVLRNELIKKAGARKGSPYVTTIEDLLSPGMKVLDIGCGTGHILQQLAGCHHTMRFVGLDISRSMLTVAKKSSAEMSDLLFVEADGLRLPVQDRTLDVVMTRLAEYSYEEAYRVLKKRGHFVEYGLGPDADREIAEFFPERIDRESFFLPRNPSRWEEEVCEKCRNSGFVEVAMRVFREKDYYRAEDEVMDLIEMVPLVTDFDRGKDREIVARMAERYGGEKGISITWHYYILRARRNE